MKESRKTKAELLDEMEKLRARVAQMEKAKVRRDKAQKTLRDTNELLERIFSTPHALLAYMNRKFNFIRVNCAYAEADGRAPDFYIGKNHFALFPNEENEAIFSRVVETGEPYTTYAKPFEYAEHPERGVSYWDWTLLPMKDAAGAVQGVMLWLVNVTDRVRAAEALSKSDEKYRLHFMHVGDVIYTTDLEFRITSISPSVENLLGYKPDELIGRRIDELNLLPSEYMHLALSNTKRVLAGDKSGPTEYEFIAKDGIRKSGEVTGAPLFSDGKVVAVISVARDITARKRAEAELANYQEHLEELVKTRTAELNTANERFHAEIAERKKTEGRLRQTNEDLQVALQEVEMGHDELRQQNEELFKTEQALRHANEQLTDTLISISDGFFSLDENLVFTYFNRAAADLLGRKAEDILGRQLLEAFPEAKGSIFEEMYMLGVKEKKPLSFESYFEILPYENWYDVRVFPRKEGISVYFRATTERKQAEEAARRLVEESRQREEEAAALLESSRAVLEYQEFSDAAKAIFESCKKLIGATSGYVSLLSRDGAQNEAVFIDSGGWECAVDPNLPMPIRGMRAEAYESGRPVYENNFPESEMQKLLPPSHAPLENALFAPLLIGGNTVGLIGLGNKPGGFTDTDARLAVAFADHAAIAFRNSRYLTAIRKSEERYRLLSESLERTVKNKVAELQQAQRLATIGRMVAAVAHEVKNPLQNIRMGVDALEKEIGEDRPKREILGEINYGINILRQIIDQLSDYSRPINLQYAPLSIGDLVRHALRMLSHKLENVAVYTELEREEGEISVDPIKMGEVVVNLISNALEAMPAGGELRICSTFAESEGAKCLKLSISDSGCGIPDEHIEFIYEPFFTTKTRGTGLGLPICKKIVDAHNGRMNIKSKRNEGTTVEIMLPR
jgi:PAS domain S-box-containing protein